MFWAANLLFIVGLSCEKMSEDMRGVKGINNKENMQNAVTETKII